LVVTAFGDAIVGDTLRKMVDRERETVRDVVRKLLPEISALLHERQAHT
jgi:hypothetical protein